MATTTWYGRGLVHITSDTSWVNDSIKVALVGPTYVPDQDAHEFYNQVTAELATANGYTQGGALLTNRTISYDPATNQARLIADPVSWSTTPDGSITARRAVIFKDTGTPATSPLLGWVDFGSDQTATALPFSINFDRAAGILRITAQ